MVRLVSWCENIQYFLGSSLCLKREEIIKRQRVIAKKVKDARFMYVFVAQTHSDYNLPGN